MRERGVRSMEQGACGLRAVGGGWRTVPRTQCAVSYESLIAHPSSLTPREENPKSEARYPKRVANCPHPLPLSRVRARGESPRSRFGLVFEREGSSPRYGWQLLQARVRQGLGKVLYCECWGISYSQ